MAARRPRGAAPRLRRPVRRPPRPRPDRAPGAGGRTGPRPGLRDAHTAARAHLVAHGLGARDGGAVGRADRGGAVVRLVRRTGGLRGAAGAAVRVGGGDGRRHDRGGDAVVAADHRRRRPDPGRGPGGCRPGDRARLPGPGERPGRLGALAERTRLSREIHDSVGQGLSSINLLLQAAEQSWDGQPAAAREHVRTAAATARDGLDEVRRVVRDLAPADLADDPTGAALATALRRAAAASATGLEVEVRVHGTPVAVGSDVAAALVRTARGALANVREHAAAGRAALTLTYQVDEVVLDVRDDGRGFDPSAVRATGSRGRGLAGIRDRASGLGGSTDVESAPGEGTTVSVRFPVAGEEGR
ncbi:sensor histidine kinase [Nocardioides convexus]|uniref:sensor histidine kinase n=1 Tax=Nocardioides convexus TaxID=2712224 RepID=UPI0024186849|nr:sensor histidine kinase [Nocardioides convexus]